MRILYLARNWELPELIAMPKKARKASVWEPPPLDPRKFDDPFRPRKKLVLAQHKNKSGINPGQILRRPSDGYLYLAP